MCCISLTGVKYLNDCPRQKKVPVYLLVGGCFGMLKVLGTMWRNIQYRRYDDMDSFYDAHSGDGAFATKTYRMMDMIISTFLLGWLIAGTYWVFSVWEPHYKQLLHEPSNWCEKHVYMFAVYQIIGCYAFLALMLIGIIIMATCYKCTNIFDHSWWTTHCFTAHFTISLFPRLIPIILFLISCTDVRVSCLLHFT